MTPDDSQLPLNLASDYPVHKRLLQLRRAVFSWLLQQNPTALATNTTCRNQGQRLDVAGFWSRPARDPELKLNLLRPYRTIGIICCTDRESCWKNCTTQPELLKQLQSLHARMHGREMKIQKLEPELRTRDSLFEEYSSWDYSQTADQEYLAWQEEAKTLETMLRKGTKLERILKNEMLNELFIAVPAHTVYDSEIPSGFGILWVTPEMQVKVIRQAESRDCAHAKQLHFAQMVAAAGIEAQMSMLGLSQSRDGNITYVIPPKRRHKKDSAQL